MPGSFLRKLNHAGYYLALVAFVASCTMVGPDFEPPEHADAEMPSVPGDVSFVETTDVRWWRYLDDEQLNTLIDIALSDSLDIQLALARLREARAEAGATRSTLRPQLGVGGQVSRDRSSAAPPGSFGESTTSTLYQGAFDASWEIDLFGGNRRAIEAASATVDARSGDAAATQVIVAAEMARTYVELRALQQRLVIASSALKNSEDVLELTKRRVQAGSGLDAEVKRAEADVSARKAQIPALEGEIERTANRIALIAGKTPGTYSDLANTPGPLPTPAAAPQIAYPAVALRVRPDIWAAERDLAAATADVGVATAELYPKLVLPGSGGVLSGSGGDLFTSDNISWSFAPSLSLELFSGGRIRSAIDAAGARAEQARIAFDQSVLNALLEISDGLSVRRSSLAQAVELRRSNASARSAANDLRTRYDLGAESIFTVLDAEAAVFDAADSALMAEAEALLALIALYKSTAGAPVDPQSYDLQNIPEASQ